MKFNKLIIILIFSISIHPILSEKAQKPTKKPLPVRNFDSAFWFRVSTASWSPASHAGMLELQTTRNINDLLSVTGSYRLGLPVSSFQTSIFDYLELGFEEGSKDKFRRGNYYLTYITRSNPGGTVGNLYLNNLSGSGLDLYTGGSTNRSGVTIDQDFFFFTDTGVFEAIGIRLGGMGNYDTAKTEGIGLPYSTPKVIYSDRNYNLKIGLNYAYSFFKNQELFLGYDLYRGEARGENEYRTRFFTSQTSFLLNYKSKSSFRSDINGHELYLGYAMYFGSRNRIKFMLQDRRLNYQVKSSKTKLNEAWYYSRLLTIAGSVSDAVFLQELLILNYRDISPYPSIKDKLQRFSIEIARSF